MEIIKTKHTNKENAWIIESYPYGRLRTQMRVWIESNKRGDRVCRQTKNPKTLIWNKPKKSTYNAIMVLYKEEETGHIKSYSLSTYDGREGIIKFEENLGDYELNNFQVEQLRILKAFNKTMENVEFSFSTTKFRHKVTGEIVEQVPIFEMNDYEEVGNENGQKDREKEQAQKDINKMVGYHYAKQDF